MNMKDPEALNIQSLMLGNRKDEIHHRNIRDSLKGKFISANSLDKTQQHWFDDIEDNFQEYYDFFIQIGYSLEGGNGYWFFTRPMSKVDLESKIKSLMKWIDNLSFLKSFNSLFGSGFTFTKADILVQFSCNVELKNLISKMFSGKSSNEDKIDALINDLMREGFIEIENEIEGRYKVLNSFGYIEEIVQKIDITEEADNEESK